MADRRSPRLSVRLEWDRRPAEPLPAASLRQTARVLPGGRVDGEGPPDRLILGDNLPALHALLADFEGRVSLCYLDPPFLSGKRFRARIGRGEDSRRPESWQTTVGYPDAWPDAAAYLEMLYPRLEAASRLLSPAGVLVLHLDWHASAYGRLLLDEIFGPERLVNEVVWLYHGPSPIRSAFNRKHDTLLIYSRSEDYTFHADAVRVPYDDATVRTFASSTRAGFGKRPNLARGKVPEDWWYFPVVARLHRERTGYPTQKPEALVERLILAFTSAGDCVADFFCGSGTTPVVASRLGRRWVACDSSALAVHTTHRRLLLEPASSPYALEQVEPLASEARSTPRISLRTQGRLVTAELLGGGLPLDEVDLWEVDWEYDGRAFVSRAQAVRGWRAAALETSLRHEYPRPGRFALRVRVADRHGQVGWAESALELT